MRGSIGRRPVAVAMVATGLGLTAAACGALLLISRNSPTPATHGAGAPAPDDATGSPRPVLRPDLGSLDSSRRGGRSVGDAESLPPSDAGDQQTGHGQSGSGPIQLRDVTRRTGITFAHTHGGSGKRYIVETVTTGLATFDYDGDGLTDVYFPNGRPLPGAEARTPARNALYRNLGGFRFVDATDLAGIGDAGYGMGCAVGDYDDDGHPDLYVSNFGPNVLYRNHGDGSFADVTATAGVGRGNRVGAGVCFLDMDGDGDLDLFAANYVKFTYDRPATWFVGGYLRYPGPREFEPEHATLFRNEGDGAFADVSLASGVAAVAGTGMGTVAGDFDNDGDTDLFVANDLDANFLFRNEGHGTFREAAVEAGVAYNFEAAATGSMGADCGDYDHDGWLDIYMTTYQAELPCLFKNLGHGVFEDVTARANAGVETLPYVNWGCGLVDFDNDGHKDLYIGNGHLEDFIEKIDRTTAYAPGNTLLRNTGKGRFVNVTATAGDGMAVRGSTRGVAFDDLDNDGWVDVVLLYSSAPAAILRNETQNGNHWIQLRLCGTKTNRDGVGARVRVVAGDLTQTDEVHSGRGYQSHWGSRLHFGLGQRDRVDRIEVRWIGGGVDVVENLAADRRITLVEGSKEAAGAAP